MENKFAAFVVLHDCFHVARRATGLPPSRILSGRIWYSSQISLHTLPEESTSCITDVAESSTANHVQQTQPNPDPQPSSSAEPEQAERSTPPVGANTESEALDFESKRPPPLRLRTLLDARRARMARRHSISAPAAEPSSDEECITPTTAPRSSLLFGHIRRRSSIGSSTPRSSTPTSPFRSAWPTPAVAFDTPAPSLDYSDSSPDSTGEADSPISRPSTSNDSYDSTRTRTPSVTSFRMLDSVGQSVQPKFDPELAETLFHGSAAQHFLRIFRAE